MTSKQPYPEEFKIEAVKQITERHHRVAHVPAHAGASQRLLRVQSREREFQGQRPPAVGWPAQASLFGERRRTWAAQADADMRDWGERCGKHRVARLLKLKRLRPQTGYRRRPAVVAPNHLQGEFTVAQPHRSWLTDTTYIRTHEGWLYLAVVLELFSRQVVGLLHEQTHRHQPGPGRAADGAVAPQGWEHPVTVHSD